MASGPRAPAPTPSKSPPLLRESPHASILLPREPLRCLVHRARRRGARRVRDRWSSLPARREPGRRRGLPFGRCRGREPGRRGGLHRRGHGRDSGAALRVDQRVQRLVLLQWRRAVHRGRVHRGRRALYGRHRLHHRDLPRGFARVRLPRGRRDVQRRRRLQRRRGLRSRGGLSRSGTALLQRRGLLHLRLLRSGDGLPLLAS